MELSKRVPFPIGILVGTLVGAILGAIVSMMLAYMRKGRGEKVVAKTPSVGDLVRLVFAAFALIRIANEFLSKKEEKA